MRSQLGTEHAARFLTHDGLWQEWLKSKYPPEEQQALIGRPCNAADECMSGG